MVSIKDLESPPHNVWAEKEFLSCIFIDSTLYWVSAIKQKHFHIPEFKKIYKAMQKVHKEWKEISVTSVSNVMWEEWADLLWDVWSYAITTSQFETSQKIIIENYNRRKVIEWSMELQKMAQNMECNIDDIMFKATVLGSNIDDIEETKTLVSWAFNTMTKYFDEHEQPTILADMWYNFLSAILWWWRAWALYVIAWKTWQGKSTLALNLCIEAVKRGIKCSIFSTEMPSHEIHTRFISREAKVEWWKIEKWKEEVADAVTTAIWKMEKWDADCNIYDTFSTKENLERLIAKEASLWSKIIFIDYLQQVRVNWTNRNIAIWDMTTMLKQMAIRYGIAIVWLSQLNRASQDNQWPPRLRDLRDSWSIEQDADVVIMIDWYDEYALPLPTLWIYVVKNRHWENNHNDPYYISYDKKYFLFVDS